MMSLFEHIQSTEGGETIVFSCHLCHLETIEPGKVGSSKSSESVPWNPAVSDRYLWYLRNHFLLLFNNKHMYIILYTSKTNSSTSQ